MFVFFALLAAPFGSFGSDPAPDEREVQRQVELARSGDRRALVRLYRWHVARVYRAVRPWCRNDADAEDVSQETFVRAFEALDRYEPMAGARFVSWLLTIARNTAIKRGRSLARATATAPRVLVDLLDARDHGADAAADLASARLRAALLELLGELASRERWVLCLRYGGELDVTEVAELTGLSSANVRKICERQRRRLLARLVELGWSPGDDEPLAQYPEGAPA